MIDKKLIHFNTYSAFEASKSLLYDWTIAFIKETKQIYTHGTFYDCDDIANIEAIDTNDTIDDPNINYLTTALQSLTDEEKQQVKENIGLNINDFDLSDYATNQIVDTKIAEIPKVTKVSQLENDKNYIISNSNSPIKNILIVSALPSSPDSQTLYLITE